MLRFDDRIRFGAIDARYEPDLRGSEPLPELEMAEAIAILRGEGPEDVSNLCYHEVAELLVMTRAAQDLAAAERQVEQAVKSGVGLAKLAEVIAVQGGDARQIEQPQLLPAAPVKTMLTTPRDSYISSIRAEQVGLASMRLGAGRFKKGDAIDHRTGFVLQAKVGDHLRKGDPLVEIHARSVDEASAISHELLACYSWSDAPVQPGPLILDVIHP